MAIALSARAGESDSLGTTSGTMAAKMGQRIAKPMPFVKVRNNNRYGFRAPATMMRVRAVAFTASHICAKKKYCLRLIMSASAPLGTPNNKTGRLDAVCTKAMSIAD